MAAESPWPEIHAERAALAEDLAGLSDEQWVTPSLCADWTVRDVLGHLTATARMTPARFIAAFAASGFRFHPMNAKNVIGETTGTPADGQARFRAVIPATTHPPGPVDAKLAAGLGPRPDTVGAAGRLLGDAAAEEARHQGGPRNRPDRRAARFRKHPGAAAGSGDRAGWAGRRHAAGRDRLLRRLARRAGCPALRAA